MERNNLWEQNLRVIVWNEEIIDLTEYDANGFEGDYRNITDHGNDDNVRGWANNYPYYNWNWTHFSDPYGVLSNETGLYGDYTYIQRDTTVWEVININCVMSDDSDDDSHDDSDDDSDDD